MPDTTVKFFASTMTGAPAMSGEAGKLIGVLDACLVDGFGSVTLDSLVVASNVATGTVSAGHNFAMVGNTGPVVTIAGATPSALNGEWRIASVPGSTTFTFATTGISDQTATGTITAKRSPAGWTKAYSGTNKAAYSRTALGATAMLLRIDDSPAQYPTLIMYETMSDVDTGTGPGPTSGSFYTSKSANASSTARPWRLYADAKTVYVYIDALSNGNYASGFAYGDIVSYKAADAYHCVLIAHPTASSNYCYQAYLGVTTGSLIARTHAQTGGAISQLRYSHYLPTAAVGLAKAGNAYPAAVDNGFHAWPVEVWETSTVIRGLLPGIWCPIHANQPNDAVVIDNIPNLSDRTLFIQKAINGDYRAAHDVTGPWR